MDVFIDHYIVLGLPSGEVGSKLSEKEIRKAYKQKAKELHPDKRPDDPNAASRFQKLQASYLTLKDEKTRKIFDDLLRVKQEKIQRQTQQDAKRRRSMSSLKERERNGYSQYPNTKARYEGERTLRTLQEEIRSYREMHANKTGFSVSGESSRKKAKTGREKSSVREKDGLGYSEERLRGLFKTFGEVKDVKSSDGIRLNEKLAGAGYQAFEDSVLQKLQKAAERQKVSSQNEPTRRSERNGGAQSAQARGIPHLIDEPEEENVNDR